ncbi:DNA excision repair protein ERCC-8-like [Paramacrobiotus metropolitanus]|uniref:DNA excision repair protein ERCC-8-like n=1 Tax=Paramacrobiotus metropolitanus TaxID=2943436 RepID=UPI0024461CBA|nr:DNA excision repair protein ERCC-8-like [Paramacrobiotus metropolitanus]
MALERQPLGHCGFVLALENPLIDRRRLLDRHRNTRARSIVLSRLKETERCYASICSCLDVSLDGGRFLLSGGGDGSINIHGLTKDSRSVQQTFPVLGKIIPGSRFAHEYAVSACQFYPHDPGVFTTSGHDGKVKVFDTAKMMQVHQFAFNKPVADHSMSYLASARPLIAVALGDNTVRICDLRTVSSAHTFSGHNHPVNCVRWSRHSPSVLASGGVDGKIILWDVRKARSLLGYLDNNNNPPTAATAATINVAHHHAVISLEFTEDAAHLVSYGADHKLRLWNIETGKNTGVNYGRIPFVFHDVRRRLQIALTSRVRPDLIFVPSDDRVLVFDMFSGEKVATLTGHFGQVLTCAYHPHFQYVFTGSTDRNILVWAPEADFADYFEEQEEAKRRELEKSSQRLAVARNLEADTWSDED